MSRKHKTVSLSEIKDAGEKCLQKPHYCTEHEAEVLKLYCKTCSKAICGDCTYVEHRNHEYSKISRISSESSLMVLSLTLPNRKMNSVQS